MGVDEGVKVYPWEPKSPPGAQGRTQVVKTHLNDVRSLCDGDADDDEEGAQELKLCDLAPQEELWTVLILFRQTIGIF
jgi:hypothetical protein